MRVTLRVPTSVEDARAWGCVLSGLRGRTCFPHGWVPHALPVCVSPHCAGGAGWLLAAVVRACRGECVGETSGGCVLRPQSARRGAGGMPLQVPL